MNQLMYISCYRQLCSYVLRKLHQILKVFQLLTAVEHDQYFTNCINIHFFTVTVTILVSKITPTRCLFCSHNTWVQFSYHIGSQQSRICEFDSICVEAAAISSYLSMHSH
jgi:hypothetical protein